MSARTDFERVSELVQQCADTMRLISRGQLKGQSPCPFRHIAIELEHLSDEIKDVAAELPPAWSEERV